jgi:benzil reductase ((S)-benzoin forming)
MSKKETPIKNYYYITGTSRGIGNALADRLLQNKSNFVFGISRTCSINYSNYKHIFLDLSDIHSVNNFSFQEHDTASMIVLINNSGMIGEIKRVGNLKDETIIDTYNVNLISPSVLINKFVLKYRTNPAEKIIINVSSGAGKYPIDAWSAYCASKAGLDLFTKVINLEQSITGEGFRVLSVAPGVVDTQMQDMLRNSDSNEFSRLNDFVQYMENGQLADPKYIASKYEEILSNMNILKDDVFSIRDFESILKGK